MIKRIIILLIALVGLGIAFTILLAVTQWQPSTELAMGDLYTLTLTVTGTPPTPTPSRTITQTPTITFTPTLTFTPTIDLTRTKLALSVQKATLTRAAFILSRTLNLYGPDRGGLISTDKITFSWSPVVNAVEYTLEIRKLTSNQEIMKERVDLTFLMLEEALQQGNYKWHVVAWDADGNRIAMSQWWEFTQLNP